jgi:large subunit ribosomal protein L6
MSKLGKKTISVPKESAIKVEGNTLLVSGPKGSKKILFDNKIFLTKINEKKEFEILPINKKDKNSSVMWGTYRSLINSAVLGVTKGHEKNLELSGVGFRANLKGKELILSLGFSHEIKFNVPEGINIKVEKQTKLNISGTDKELVSKIASEIKAVKPVEPYKGKGIKEKGQYVLRKEGKKK